MNLWCPFVTWNPGKDAKAGYPLPWPYGGYRGPKVGEVKHSAEGFWPGIYSRLFGSNRASWHFTVGYDRSEQHYAIDVNCWHAGDTDDDGGVRANIALVGIEHLGTVGHPLTPYQIDMTTRISRWQAEQFGRLQLARYPTLGPNVWTLAEHNEVSDEPTACPSGRIPWAEIIKEDDMALTMVACGDSPTGYRVYAIGQGAPRWITDGKAAEQLIALFGAPKAVAWRALVALGA